MTGTVEIRRRGQAYWEAAAVGMPLREGDWVRTGKEAEVRVRFAKGGAFVLDAESTLLVDLAAVPDGGDATERRVVVALDQGSGHGEFAAGDGGEPLYVRAADGSEARLSAGDGEAEFELRKDDSGGVEVRVTSGEVELTTGSEQIEVGVGKVASLKGGRAERVELPRFPASVAPGIDARFHCAEAPTIELSWKRVDSARSYRVQLARDISFRRVITEVDVRGTRYAFEPLDQGLYTWRVASRDGKGRLGEYGFARRMYCETEPPKDLLLTPRDGARLSYQEEAPRVQFSWRSDGAAESYLLRVSRTDDPSAGPIIEHETTGQSYAAGGLGAGRYSWGVYARQGDESRPLFLAPRQLVIRQAEGPRARTEGLWR